jgi:lysyl-tRNA synthetase class 2
MMTSKKNLNKLELNRLEKLESILAKGINPYPAKSERTHTSLEAIEAFELLEKSGEETEIIATLVGRIRSIRPMGKLAFTHIEDGYGRIQLFIRQNDVGEEELEEFKKDFDLGDFIQASGVLFRTRTGEISLRVSKFTMISKAITPLPADKDHVDEDGETVRHSVLSDPETRYRQRYADLAVNQDVREIFIKRAKITKALRDFMDSNGFIEVETPILQPIYGGAAAKPFVTHHNQLKQDLYLRISFELYLKRLIVGGIERVYEIGRDFRNEGVDRTHNPEFTQLEFYWAYADYKQVMEFTEKMVAYTVEQVHGTTEITYQGNKIDFGKPWQRIELKAGIKDATGIDLDEFEDQKSLFEAAKGLGVGIDEKMSRGKIIETLLSEFVEPICIQPTFIYNYPRDISPLAKSIPGNPNTVERFEGFIAGFELCNAFSELNDPIDQEKRFIEMGRTFDSEKDDDFHPIDEDYLKAMRYGMPPNGGFGMGVDRLAMILTDKANIREVILFPHLRNRE